MKKVAVKKLEISEAISYLAILSAVVVASLPLLLGDDLVVVLSKAAREGASVIEGFGNSVLMFLGL
jgi:hypothetical protein